MSTHHSHHQGPSAALNGLISSRNANKAELMGRHALDQPVRLATADASYLVERVVGSGAFGVVLLGRWEQTGENVAIKRVLQDRRYKNRELQIMQMLRHNCIVNFLGSFFSAGSRPDELFLNAVMEYLPENLYQAMKTYSHRRTPFPPALAKVFAFQLCRALAYMHSLGACHRDIKPQNLLVDMPHGILKLCDFGSAKVLSPTEPNVSYICSRYYRAPELLFGATFYTTAIDVWSLGCVLAEMFLLRPIFRADTGIGQMLEIIKVIGAPSREDVLAMNKTYPTCNFPDMRHKDWRDVFPVLPEPLALDFLDKTFVYHPQRRSTALQLLAHPYFADLADSEFKLPGGESLPANFFEYSKEELKEAETAGILDKLPGYTPSSEKSEKTEKSESS